MRRLAHLATIWLCLTGLILFAQESEAEKVKDSTGVTEHGPSLIWGWLNFLLLVGGLGYVIKKNVGPYYAKRSLEIRKGIAEADAVRQESQAAIAEVERRLANLQSEIEAMKRSAQAEAEAASQRARKEAAAELAKIQTHTTEEIAAAGKSARLELRRYTAELALSLAEQKISARLTPETDDRLVRTFVSTLEHTVNSAEN